MAANYSYDPLATVHDAQDTADANEASSNTTLNPPQWSRRITRRPLPSYSMAMDEKPPFLSVDSFESFNSVTSTTSSFEKLKNLGNRIRRKPLPHYLPGSIRMHPAAEIEPSRVGKGVWKDQLLIDRSIREMAALMTFLAIGMIILIALYADHFRDRANINTTSVGGDASSCETVTRTNTACLLLINVCATMILGMSTTYQQLVTSLTITDIKHVLCKFGDSRVGTNSPFSINQKREGRKRSWAAWLFLIMTSMPVHFLANSLIGPSFIQSLPSQVVFHDVANMTAVRNGMNSDWYDSETINGCGSFVCWSALRTGKPHFPESLRVLESTRDVYGTKSSGDVGRTWDTIKVHDDANCTNYVKTATDIALLEQSYFYNANITNTLIYGDGDCVMGNSVYCTVHDERQGQCRLNVRMSAAFILAACLTLKATYMLSVNFLARGKLKSQCLTFGDVIVASASDPDLRVQGECMVNGGDNYRRHNTHTCHKHCRGVDDSKTGDELGHCQKCKRWNTTDMFSNEPQPTIATKFKKSLISNLGNTALTQMCLLMLCTLALVGASIAIAVPLGMANKNQKENCNIWYSDSENKPGYCSLSDTARIEQLSGGWGGFNRSLTAAALEPDRLSNEVLSFAISNGAQFIYSLLYLMMIYNITLISQEHTWGKLEYGRKRLRTTLVAGESFAQDYLLQLPKKILFPTMAYSILTHWMLGEALQTQEAIWLENADGRHVEHSRYNVTYAAYPVWTATFLSLLMTGVCWWAFTYKREGFIPQMYGSIRVLCAATTQLDDFPSSGIQWGDLGEGKTFQHAGLAAKEVMKIVPNALYAGRDPDMQGKTFDRETLDEKMMQRAERGVHSYRERRAVLDRCI